VGARAAARPLPPGPSWAGRRLSQVPAAAAAETHSWLGRCEGFLVEAAAGVVGVVEDVVFGLRGDRPDLLLVRRGGENRLRVLEVPAERVAEVHPGERRLLLDTRWKHV
jgi:hypothetical protein